MPGPKPGRSKKAKPSFDVAREPITAAHSGWVYRSDAPPSRQVIDVEPVALTEPDPPVTRPLVVPPTRSEPLQRRLAFDDDDRDQSGSWLATGIYLMAVPITLGMAMMFAPFALILGTRSRR